MNRQRNTANGAAPVVCIGEVLWDALPDGLFLGGAVFNVSYHLNRLGTPAVMASRVGTDRLGTEIRARMAALGQSDRLVQWDTRHETGFVRVFLDREGVPGYEILGPVAWDFMEASRDLLDVAQVAPAVVFGTLAQRSVDSRKTIRRVLASPGIKVLDVNLRPPDADPDVVGHALEAADLAKMAFEELNQFAAWWHGPEDFSARVAWLAERFGIRRVCVTAGGDGAWLLDPEGLHRAHGIPIRVADTVGAGDAFLAGLTHALLTGKEGPEALDYANRLGALVASRDGATPDYEPGELVA
ncbi:MAG: carbohydrate kinase [Rhodothermales bacterium]|nr:carbohydrate kinase [Rhodothermales bacterium]MBO6780002.1 carbohydrate kinase [Rhodothermales bacterium]